MKKKILFTTPNLKSGGAQRHLVNIINSLDKSKFDISLFIYSDTGELKSELKNDIKIFSPGSGTIAEGFQPAEVLFGIIELVSVIRRVRPDALYSRHWCKIPNAFIGKLFSVTSVSGEGNNIKETLLKNEFKMKLFYYIRKIGLSYTDNIIANSYSLADELNEVFRSGARTEVIQNGVNINRIIDQSGEEIDHPWYKEKIPLIVSVGRLSEQKGFKYLLDSVGLLKNELNVRLIIIGEGRQKNELLNRTERLGISDRVDILDPVTNPFPYMAKADLLVCSSIYEGLSNVILEAMAAGVPVISTDHKHGASEIIETGKNGILVPVADPESLAAAVKLLLTDKRLKSKIKKEATKRVKDFSLEKLGSRYEEYFNKVLASSETL